MSKNENQNELPKNLKAELIYFILSIQKVQADLGKEVKARFEGKAGDATVVIEV